MQRQLTALALMSTLAFSGCASINQGMQSTGSGTAIGAGLGAVAGAIIGNATSGGSETRSTITGALIGAAIGAGGGYVWSQRMQAQKAALDKATAGTGVDVSKTADNRIKLDIPADVSFDVNSYTIKSNFRSVLDKFAQTMKTNAVTTVYIVGHTDSSGSDAINQPLSVNRAASTRDYLVGRGVASSRFNISGMGSTQPVASNSTEAGLAQNRRVEIYIGEEAK
ncbi:OmpA family protein [Hydromonas duriensis]|uniref:Outer membrane protein OmpA-like peptidoglycan-associated protein n=1 Tax=Hydromonas duriensis TaxID=1527608 RepID=A0A4R6Y842_9BURK|nr:OmpA family protein [Hydromonas duriensis]TDR31512.1 outer membrane protein OmpA-like peptidoglycan-associated protein [Hydromonas duriensis]